MKVESVHLQRKSNFMTDYQKHDENIMRFFEYNPFHDFDKRLKDLQNRKFKREKLSIALHNMNESWGASKKTLNNINRLQDESSVVVIGGQQAGLLSGPMYTINKVISIIKLAKQQEEELQVPVVPVFWIAGEDHDFAEINHINLVKSTTIEKHQIDQFPDERKPVSETEIDDEAARQWIDEIFIHLQETIFTKDLYKTIGNCVNESRTYVDFFARFINHLFANEGLVLIDSNDPSIRDVESEYFKQIINNQEEIAKQIYTAAHVVRQSGYELTIEPVEDDAHLFYHLNGERILLSRSAEGRWIGKQNEVDLSTEELLKIAEEKPNLLSNNVVTRPLMQDLLLPTLAFVGGWGEISYWSVLKNAFKTLHMTMPPVTPRLSFTYVDQRISKIVEKYTLDYEQIISEGVYKQRMNWLASQPTFPTNAIANQIKQDLDNIHEPLRAIAGRISPDLRKVSETNLDYIHNKIDYLVHTIQKDLAIKHENELTNFALVQMYLYPDNQLQERIFNPIDFLNKSGPYFIDKVINEHLSFEKDHFLIFI